MASIKNNEYNDCPICIENKRVTCWVVCPKCSFSCCRECVEKYLLNVPEIYPKCMKCSIQWSFEFLSDNTHIKFHNVKYRNYRAELLLQREKSLLPQAQPYVVERHKNEKIRVEIKKMEAELKKYKEIINQIVEDINHKKTILRSSPKISEEKSERNIRPCHQKDCRGFISSKYVCGLCENKVCSKCLENVHEDECDKNKVENVKMIKDSTKPCPKCAIPIYKIDGCDQMWCPECLTAFSWRTGRLETGSVHNPHFYEYQRQINNGRAPRVQGDIQCGGPVNFTELLRRQSSQKIDILTKIVRNCNHISAVIMPVYANVNIDYTDLRVQYLIDGDLKKWLRMLKYREKKREKKQAVYLVLSMYVNTTTTLLNNIIQNPKHTCEIIEQLIVLRKYASSYLKKIAYRFQNKIPIIKDNWDVIHPMSV